MNTPPSLSAETSAILKGLAILMMLFHHCCGYSNWVIIPDIRFSCATIGLALNSKLCVSIFAFLTAYAFFFHRDKSHIYVLRKIIVFLCHYWMILLFVYLSAAYLLADFSLLPLFLCDILPTKAAGLMQFAWYVTFYAMLMLLLPYLNAAEKAKGILFQTVFPILSGALFSFFLKSADLQGSSFVCAVLMGHFCAKFNIINRLVSLFCQKSAVTRLAAGIASLLLFYAWFRLPANRSLSFLFMQGSLLPLILSLLLLQPLLKKLRLLAILNFLGKHSMNIWFLHCLFFADATKALFQPLIYWSNTPALVVLSTLLLCLPIAVSLTYLQAFLSGYIKRLPLFSQA